ncbi:hypothetical protein KI387_006491, partial [Taxus chinensis]
MSPSISDIFDAQNDQGVQEIAYLKNLLAQKEAILESTRQELQKSLYYSYKSSQQNKQLTQTNGQMFAELCMLREKYKLLEHDYKQMTSVFRIKRAELEETVRDLSQQFGNKHQVLTKDIGQSKNPFQSAPWNLSTNHTQNCYSENPGEESNGAENNPGNNLLTKEAKTNDKRASTKGHLIGKRASHLTTSCRQGGQAVSMPTLNQIDQCNASFSEATILEEVIADDICNEADSLSIAKGSANEEALKGKRASTKGHLTGKRASHLTRSCRQGGQAVSMPTLNQMDQCNASFSDATILEEVIADDICNEADSLSMAKGSANEEALKGKRASTKGHLTGKRASRLTRSCRQGGQAVSMPTLNQIDQCNASFREATILEEVIADDICNEAASLSIAKGSANEEALKGKRTCLRRQSTSVSYYESPLHKKARKELAAVSTPTSDQIDQPGASLSRIGIRGEFCDDYIHKEGDCLPRANMSINEEASNEKRISLRTRSAHVSYKEPSLNTKLRRSGQTVSTQNLARSDKHNTSNVLENLENTRKGDGITDEPDRLSTLNVTANEENKNGKRSCSKQCPVVSTNGDSNVKAKTKHEEQTLQTLDTPQSDALHVNLSETPKCPKTEDIASKATRVQQQHLQETSPCHTLASNTASEATKIRSSTGRPALKTVESMTSSKEFLLNKVGEIKELHCNAPRKFGDLSSFSEFPQNCDLPTKGITSKATRVQQHQTQESAPFHASTFNTALDATELRRSSTGRP